jgi:quercetin dioxygenase-like cupin family protein
MAKLNTGAEAMDHGPVVEWQLDVDGQNINIVHFNATVDATPLLKGLPNDQCQAPHWGYVIKGEVSYTIDGVEEIYRQGDAFYVPAGHTSGATAGAEIVQFSPSDLLHETEKTIMRNMQAMTSN